MRLHKLFAALVAVALMTNAHADESAGLKREFRAMPMVKMARDAFNTPAKIEALSDKELATYFGAYRRDDLRAELVRRGTLTPAEWVFVDAGAMHIGMRRVALICSWGYPMANQGAVNRTVTPEGVAEQFVYRDTGAQAHRATVYVYVRDGVVTSFQD